MNQTYIRGYSRQEAFDENDILVAIAKILPREKSKNTKVESINFLSELNYALLFKPLPWDILCNPLE